MQYVPFVNNNNSEAMDITPTENTKSKYFTVTNLVSPADSYVEVDSRTKVDAFDKRNFYSDEMSDCQLNSVFNPDDPSEMLTKYQTSPDKTPHTDIEDSNIMSLLHSMCSPSEENVDTLPPYNLDSLDCLDDRFSGQRIDQNDSLYNPLNYKVAYNYVFKKYLNPASNDTSELNASDPFPPSPPSANIHSDDKHQTNPFDSNDSSFYPMFNSNIYGYSAMNVTDDTTAYVDDEEDFVNENDPQSTLSYAKQFFPDSLYNSIFTPHPQTSTPNDNEGIDSNQFPNSKPRRNKPTAVSTPPRRQRNRRTQSLKSEIVNWRDYVGNVIDIARNQNGCRFLQQKLESSNSKLHRDQIFAEIIESIGTCMRDPFGNYLVQKLCQVCTDEQFDMIIIKVLNDIEDTTKNMHGTRAIQQVIQRISSQKEFLSQRMEILRNRIRPHIVDMVKDQNANHVIQRCVNCLPPEECSFIYDELIMHAKEVSEHRHGCCVVQRCLDVASPEYVIKLSEAICDCVLRLAADPFGNYVIQYLIMARNESITNRIRDEVAKNIVQLSMQKFSSNVVEKCLIASGNQNDQTLVNALIESADSIITLLLDNYGNYVIQRALQVASAENKIKLYNIIRPSLYSIKNKYNSKIVSKILKRYPQLSAKSSDKASQKPNSKSIGSSDVDEQELPPPCLKYYQKNRGD